MTVLTSTNKRIATGDGSTTAFAFTFAFFENSEIEVYLDGVLKTEITDYTLVNSDPGGTVTFLVAPGSAVQVLIKRVLPVTQTFDYIENDPFPAESHEEALDRAIMILQQGEEVLNRTLRLVPTATAVAPELDDLTGNAGKTLRVNVAETGVELVDISSGGVLTIPLPVSEGGTQATTASGARTNLDTFEDVFTTRGDILRAGASGAEERLALGAANTVLTSDGTDAAWAALPAQSGQLLRTTYYTANDTWTLAADVGFVEVEVVGGGGGGGGSGDTANRAGGSGGGGGYSKKKILRASLGATETVTIGAGGAAGTETTSGGSGGTTSFGVHLNATGGEGGTVGSSAVSAGALGGGGASGDLNISGDGGFPSNQLGATGGPGGSSHFGGGAPGSSTNGTGVAGGNHGGGGSGGSTTITTGKVGAAGAPGLVIVKEYS